MEAEKEKVVKQGRVADGVQKSFFVRLESSVKPELHSGFKAILDREVKKRGQV